MGRDTEFSDNINNILNEVLPGDLNSVAEKITDSSDKDWWRTNYTFAHQVNERTRREVARSTINQLGDDLGVSSNTVTFAEALFEQFDDSTDSIHIIELYAGAALYCACKLLGEAINPNEFEEIGIELLTRKTLLRRTKQIATELKLDISAFTDAAQYAERYCDELSLDPEIRGRALSIIEACDNSGVNSGKSPTGWAAAAVYFSNLELDKGLTQSDVAKVANVSEVTIRNRYQEQLEFITDQEPNATDPRSTVHRIQGRLDLPSFIASEAKSLLDDGERDGLQINGNYWGVAAISLASKAHDMAIGYRALNAYTPASSQKIRECEQLLNSTQD